MIKLHYYQTKVLQSNAKYIIAIAGWQGGKTTAGAYRLARAIDEATEKWYKKGKKAEEKPLFMICGPDDEEVRNTQFAKFMEIIPEGTYRFAKTEKTLTFLKSGIKIRGYGVHDPTQIESITVDFIWADEPGLYKPAVWGRLQPRVSIRRGSICFTGTAYHKTWIYKTLYVPAMEGNKDYDYISWRSIDNPKFSIEEYKRLQRETPKALFDMKYNAIWSKHSGSVYDFNESEQMLAETPKNFKAIICGVDFAQSKPCAYLVIGIDENNKYYAIDEFKEAMTPFHVLKEKLKAVNLKYHISYFYCDPEDKDAISQLQAEKLPVVPADNTVSMGIDHVDTLLFQKKLFFNTACTKTKEEIVNYSYSLDSNNEYTDKPVKNNDHLMDALRYALYTSRTQSFDNNSKVAIDLDKIPQHIDFNLDIGIPNDRRQFNTTNPYFSFEPDNYSD